MSKEKIFSNYSHILKRVFAFYPVLICQIFISSYSRVPSITQAIISASDVPVFAGVGGGYTNGQRSVNMAAAAEQLGAFGVVCNAMITNEAIRDIKSMVEIPVVFTVVSEHVDLDKRLAAGADIVNVSGAARTPEIVAEIRAKYPELPIIATGGPTDETILTAIRAGANAITYTPPSSKDLFARDMQEYRDWYEAHRREVDEMLNEE